MLYMTLLMFFPVLLHDGIAETAAQPIFLFRALARYSVLRCSSVHRYLQNWFLD